MTQEHTPGPWTAHVKHGHQMTISAKPRGDIAVSFGNDPEADANAALIAAAPDLLAALDNALPLLVLSAHKARDKGDIEAFRRYSNSIIEIEEAAKKARGQAVPA